MADKEIVEPTNPIQAQQVESPLEAETKQTADLPSEAKEQLPEHAQQIFLAAFKASQDDGMDQEAAKHVAWNSVKQQYEQGEDGNWHRKSEDSNVHNKATQLGGN